MKYLIDIIGEKKKKESNNTSRTDICQNKQLRNQGHYRKPAKETDNKRPKNDENNVEARGSFFFIFFDFFPSEGERN